MKILQISDLHLPAAPGRRSAGVDTLGRCRRLLRAIGRERADLLVITGDVAAEQGSRFCYEFVRQELTDLAMPWVVLPGNHDRNRCFGRVFGTRARTGLDIFPRNNGADVVFFDNSTEAPDHLPLLEAYLARVRRPVCLFTHYPPIPVGHPGYDGKHRLAWREELFAVLQQSAVACHVFFGHIHFAFRKRMRHLHFHAVPSGTAPIIPGPSADRPDRRGLYFREITHSGAEWTTRLRRI